MTVTEAMRLALEQTQRINRLQVELAEATVARAKALEVVGPALAIVGREPEVLTLAPAALQPDHESTRSEPADEAVTG